MSICMFILMYQSSSHCSDFREIWYWRLIWKTVEKIGIGIRQFALRSKYVLLLPLTLNHHKSAVFEWNGIRLLRYPRRCIKSANTPQCYGIRALPTCCFSLFVQSAVGLNSVRGVVNITSLNESDNGMKILCYRTFVRNVCFITSPQERVTSYSRSLTHLFSSNIWREATICWC